MLHQKKPSMTRTRKLLFLCGAIFAIYLFITFFSSSSSSSSSAPTEAQMNFKVGYVVYNSKWKPKHFIKRIREIQKSWATRIRKQDSIYYAVGTDYEEEASNDDFMLPLDMKDKPLIYMLGKLHSEGQFDWIYFAADASYVIPENLVHFISQLNQKSNYYLGFPLRLPTKGEYSSSNMKNLIFNSPSGMLFSKRAAAELMEAIKERKCVQNCYEDGHCPEEILIAYCLRQKGILAQDTRDPMDKDRFNIFQPLSVVGENRSDSVDYNIDNSKWVQIYSTWRNKMISKTNENQKNVKLIDKCSPGTINFHYVDEIEISALFQILYRVRETLLNSKLPSFFISDQKLLNTILEVDEYAKIQPKFGGYIEPQNVNVRELLLNIIEIGHSYSSEAPLTREIPKFED